MNGENKNIYDGFSENFKRLRKELGKTQEEMAIALKTTKITIFRYEKGEAKPGLKVFEILNKDLNVNLNWLIAGGDKNKMFVEKSETANRLNINDIYPGIPNQKDVMALIKGLEVPIVRYSLIAKFMELEKDYKDFIKDHYEEKELP